VSRMPVSPISSYCSTSRLTAFRSLKKPVDQCFFTGSTSTLRKHINRYVIKSHIYFLSNICSSGWNTHGERYLKGCKAAGLTPKVKPSQAATVIELDDDGNEVQATLDMFIQPTPKWTKEGLLDHIVEYIVSNDMVCTLSIIVATVLMHGIAIYYS
jgi:hypothetical protein